MSDYLKKGLLLGIGAAISGKERLDQLLKDLVDRNEITQDQAKNVMQNFIEKGEVKTEEWNTKQKEQMQNTAKNNGVATQADIDEIKSRLNIIEAELKLNEQNSAEENTNEDPGTVE